MFMALIKIPPWNASPEGLVVVYFEFFLNIVRKKLD